mmetsp:Transcript_42680/g.65472  ORF Transcript_42680/g.65472 Transcript_42680/m.65472 type:complete len:212 (-) Transcript_42680:343-978(-)
MGEVLLGCDELLLWRSCLSSCLQFTVEKVSSLFRIKYKVEDLLVWFRRALLPRGGDLKTEILKLVASLEHLSYSLDFETDSPLREERRMAWLEIEAVLRQANMAGSSKHRNYKMSLGLSRVKDHFLILRFQPSDVELVGKVTQLQISQVFSGLVTLQLLDCLYQGGCIDEINIKRQGIVRDIICLLFLFFSIFTGSCWLWKVVVDERLGEL